MFLTEDDYRVVCDEDELDILTRSEPETRQKAERVAMEGRSQATSVRAMILKKRLPPRETSATRCSCR